MNKINEIKLQLTTLEDNFKKQASIAVEDGDSDEAPMYSLAQKKSNVSSLKKMRESLLLKIPKVQELEITLGLPDDVQDQDLVQVTKTLKKGLEEATKIVQE